MQEQLKNAAQRLSVRVGRETKTFRPLVERMEAVPELAGTPLLEAGGKDGVVTINAVMLLLEQDKTLRTPLFTGSIAEAEQELQSEAFLAKAEQALKELK